MSPATRSSSRDWFADAMETLKVYFPKDAGEGTFWEKRIRHYKAILDDVDQEEMKSIVRHIAETRKYPTLPSAAELREVRFQLRNASYPGYDPAEERERQEREAERLQPGWIDAHYDAMIRPLSREKQEFIRSIPGGNYGKLGAVLVFKNLQMGLPADKAAEWRALSGTIEERELG